MSRALDEVALDREKEQLIASSERARPRTQGEMIDQEARDTANKALGETTSHEKLCVERWANQQRSNLAQTEAVGRVEAALTELNSNLNKRMGNFPAGLIAALFGLCGVLATLAFSHH